MATSDDVRAHPSGEESEGHPESRAAVRGSAGPSPGEERRDLDVGEFARATAEPGDEAGLGGGQGDLGAGGDLAGDFGGLDEEGDEGTPA
ncbi:MAG: hypothetical protein M3327_10960 [Actinomycetota bacterium]|nr:hypothetical protein [Actinomycetota bacterium]